MQYTSLNQNQFNAVSRMPKEKPNKVKVVKIVTFIVVGIIWFLCSRR